jgi:NADPH:quinone reductase-like Zn-dependent oxidoreductase
MKAVVCDRYGPPEVLHIAEVDRPVPTENEVLVRVHATTVTRSDCGFRAADPFFSRVFIGLRKPKRRITGMELAGVVEEVGSAVTQFAVGDEVFGIRGGAHAEYICVREAGALAHKPVGLSFEEAAALSDGSSIAIACLKKADLGPGKRIVVYGATGAIGTAGVQLAKASGAHVTAVANTKNLELVRSLGADEVLDYTQEDFTRNGETYAAIFDAVGKQSFRRCRRSLEPGGVFITTDLGFMWHVPPLALASRWIGDRRVTLPIPKYAKEDVLRVKELVEAGRYKAVIDRTYRLEEVIEATKYVETGQKTGNVVLTVAHNGAGAAS